MKILIFSQLCVLASISTTAFAGSKESSQKSTAPSNEISLFGWMDLEENTNDDNQFRTSKNVSLLGSYLWIIDSFEIGPDLGYQGAWSKAPTYRSRFSNIAAGVRTKYNFADLTRDTVIPYMTAGAQYLASYEDLFGKSSSTGNVVSGGFGCALMATRSVAITLELVYLLQHDKEKSEDEDGVDVRKSKSLKTNIGISLFL